jgi:hypothetical protein
MAIEYEGISLTIIMPFNIGHEVTLALSTFPRNKHDAPQLRTLLNLSHFLFKFTYIPNE